MAFTKGKSGNPNGRPRGAKNKVASDIKSWIANLISANRQQIESDLESLDPAERLRFFLALLNYAVPKQQSVKADMSSQGRPLDLKFEIVRCRNDDEP